MGELVWRYKAVEYQSVALCVGIPLLQDCQNKDFRFQHTSASERIDLWSKVSKPDVTIRSDSW